MGQREAAHDFFMDWKGRGNEKSDTQSFWIALLRDIFGVAKPDKFFKSEVAVSFEGHTHWIDIYIPSTRVLIEQKSITEKIFPTIDENPSTPFGQALRYAENMSYDERPRWIVTCNFAEFHIYYVQKYFYYFELTPPVIVKLENLPDEYDRLKFLVDPNDTIILEDVNFSKTALAIISKVHEGFRQRYVKYPVDEWREHLYKICVRLVFCFFADDSYLFDEKGGTKFFAEYLQQFSGEAQIDALQKIFDVLNTPENMREDFDEVLKKFPYVDGKLFEEKLVFPNFQGYHTTPIAQAFHDSATEKFNWNKISPPIFGSLFEDFLNPDVRRQGGMHYTSVENIHKVIDPLFLDDLRAELQTLKHAHNNKLQRLKAFQDKLASLTFFDPAAGSGNFLTETFLSIRKLENEAIREMYKLDRNLFDDKPIKVTIKNFYGIEIHSYAVAVTQVAMWIANLQMLRKTEHILGRYLNPLPIEDSANIIHANALRIDWAEIVPRDKLSYIFGNPPFVGYTFQTAQQKADLLVATKLHTKKMDYVVSWYYKAAEFIQGTNIQCAFVSTSSITQGEQVAVIWKPLFEAGVKIRFAYRTFKWISDSEQMAAVHCVIISFNCAKVDRRKKSSRKTIFYIEKDNDDEVIKSFNVQNINAYLLDAPNIFIASRTTPICDVPQMIYGNKPADGGNLIIDFTVPKMNKGSMPADGGNLIIECDEYDDFTDEEKKFIRPFVGAAEFIKGKKRFCLWLVDVPLSKIAKLPNIKSRVEAVKNFRLQSKKAATREDASRPNEFQEIRQPSTNYLLVPRVSSENRRYIPMGFVSPEVIASDAVHIIPNANSYHFGVLTSSVHMAWMRAICGRLEIDYRYSKNIVYNNFVWCKPTDIQRKKIELTAQKILDTRADFAGKTLAWLYDEATMPDELRAAHAENDAAVMEAYGFDENLSEAEIVATLMKMYEKLTNACST